MCVCVCMSLCMCACVRVWVFIRSKLDRPWIILRDLSIRCYSGLVLIYSELSVNISYHTECAKCSATSTSVCVWVFLSTNAHVGYKLVETAVHGLVLANKY